MMRSNHRRLSGFLARLALVAFVLPVALLGLGASHASAAGYSTVQVAQPQVDPCTAIPGGLSGLLCNKTVNNALKKVAGEVLGKAISKSVNTVAGPVGAAVGNSFFDAADSAVRGGANTVLGSIGNLISKVQTPNLQAAWFITGFYDRMVGLVMGVILLLMFIVRIIGTSYRSDWAKEMAKAGMQMVVAIVLMFVTIYMFQLALFFADKLAGAVSGEKSGTFVTLMQQLLKKSSGSIWLDLVMAGLMFLFAFLLWIELIVRSVCMFAGLLLAPLAFASRTLGEWGDRITWRLITFLGALVFSLPLMVALLGLGVAVSNNLLPDSAAAARIVTAAFFLMLAFISPWPIIAWTKHVQATVRGRLHAKAEAASAEASGGRKITGPEQTSRQVSSNLGPKSHFGQNLVLPAAPGNSRTRDVLGYVSRAPGAIAAAGVIAGPEGALIMKAVRVETTRRRLENMRPPTRGITSGR